MSLYGPMCRLHQSLSPSPSVLPGGVSCLSDLPFTSVEAGIRREIDQIIAQPQPGQSIYMFRHDTNDDSRHEYNPSAFLRWVEGIAGIRMRRHFDLTSQALTRLLAPDAIRSHDDITRLRKEWIERVGSSSTPPFGVGDTNQLPALLARITELIGSNRAKQLLQSSHAIPMLALLDSIPSGSLGACRGFMEEPACLSLLWRELETAARLLTLHASELESLIKLAITVATKTASATALLRCVELLNLARVTYASVELHGLGPLLQRFHVDVLHLVWKEVGESTGMGSHIYANAFRSHFLARIDSKPGIVSSSHSTISQVTSFILTQVGILAETQVCFNKFSHLRQDDRGQINTPASAIGSRPASINLPFVLDFNSTFFHALIEQFHQVIHARQNERINLILQKCEPVVTSHSDEISIVVTSASSSSLSSSTADSASASPSFLSSARSDYPGVTASLRSLFSSGSLSTADHGTSVKLLLKLLGNILSAPANEKYRRIKSSHQAFVSLIRAHPERIAILRVIGFEREEHSPNSSCVTPTTSEYQSLTPLATARHIDDESDTPTRLGSESPPSGAADEFMFLPTARLDIEMVRQMHDRLRRALELQSAAAATLTPIHRLNIDQRNIDTSPIAAIFLPHMPTALQPQASQYDFLHLLSLIKLFFYTASTYNAGVESFSPPGAIRSQLWKSFVDHLLSLLCGSPGDLTGDASLEWVTDAHSSHPFHEYKEMDQIRSERGRVIEVIALAFPFSPPSAQRTILHASMRDDALRAAMIDVVRDRGLSLMPTQSIAPFQSVWERLRNVPRPNKDDPGALAAEPQLMHILISQLSTGNLNLPPLDSPGTNVYRQLSPATRRVMEYIHKGHSLSAKHALLRAHASHMAATQRHSQLPYHNDPFMMPSPTLSPAASPFLSPVRAPAGSSLTIPSLSLEPRAASNSVAPDDATHAKEFQRSELASPTATTTASHAFGGDTAFSRATHSPAFSPSPSPSPSPSSPTSPSASFGWAIAQTAHTSDAEDIDMQQYERIIESVLRAIQSPKSHSPVACTSGTAADTVTAQYCLLFQSMYDTWFSRTLCPLTSYDAMFAPALVKLCMSSFVRFALVEVERESRPADDAANQPAIGIIAMIAPMMLSFNGLINIVSIPLDPLFLSHLYSLHTAMGGFSGCSDAVGRFASYMRPGDPITPVASYSNLFHLTLPTDPVVDFVRSTSTDPSPLVQLLRSHSADSTLIDAAVRLQADMEAASIITTRTNIPEQLVEIIQEHVFNLKAASPKATPLYPNASLSRLNQSSLTSCQLCGRAFIDADSLWHHTLRGDSGVDSICSDPLALTDVRRRALLYLIGSASRHLASSHPSRDLVASTVLDGMDVRLRPDGTPVRSDTDIAATVTSESELNATLGSNRGHAIPKNSEQWLMSDIMKGGIEDAFLQTQSAPVLPGGGADLTHSAHLFPFFHSAANSLAASKVNSPTHAKRAIEETHIDDKSDSTRRVSFETNIPATSFDDSTLGRGDFTGGRLDAFDVHMSAKESITPTLLKEYAPRLTDMTVGLVSLAAPPAVPAASPPHDQTARRKSLTINTTNETKPHLTTGNMTPPMMKGNFVSFPVSPVVGDPYPHAQFLSDLIFGASDSRLLDAAIMSLPSMRVYAAQRRMVGECGSRASRAIAACILKHTGKVELAVEFTARHIRIKEEAKPPNAIVKVWRLSCELLPEFITLHQNGLINYCSNSSCDQTVVELTQSPGYYQCGNGHVRDDCISRETVKYADLAQRVMHSCEFLLRMKPARAHMQAEDEEPNHSTKRLDRIRRILRVRLLTDPQSPVSSPAPSLVGSPDDSMSDLKLSGSNSWSSPHGDTGQQTELTQAMPQPMHETCTASPTASLSRDSSDSDMHDGGNTPTAVKPNTVFNTSIDNESTRPPPSTHARMDVRSDLDADRREQLRIELLASRLVDRPRSSRVPLSSLILAFCRDVSIDTARRARHLEAKIRASVILAEHRIRGLESIAYIMRHAATEYKAAAIVQFNTCIHAWQKEPPSSARSAASVLSAALGVDIVGATSIIDSPPFQVPHRYDFGLHGIGMRLLTQVQEAFYVGLSVNAAIIKQAMQAIGMTQTNDGQGMAPYGATNTIARINATRTVSGPIPSQSTIMNPFESISCLFLALNSWFICYSSSAADVSLLHTIGILPLLRQLMYHFNEVRPAPAGDATGAIAHDIEIRCQAIGRQARRLFRAIALMTLTQVRESNTGAADRDGMGRRDSIADDANLADGGDAPQVMVALLRRFRGDGFEASLLHMMFDRAEELIFRRMHTQTAEARDTHRHAFIHKQDEQDCFDTLSILLLSCSEVHVRIALTHHDDSHVPHASSVPSLSMRCSSLLSSLLHPTRFPMLSMRCQRRAIGLCHALLPLWTPTAIDRLWNQPTDQTHTTQPSEERDADRMEIEQETTAEDKRTNHQPVAGTPMQLIPHLLNSIGYHTCGNFLEFDSPLRSLSTARCLHISSELISLVRHLHQSKLWSLSVDSSLAAALRQLHYAPLDPTDKCAAERVYAAFGAIMVYGGFAEPIRIGARVRIHRITRRAEKLSQRESTIGSENGESTAIGTVVGFEADQPIVTVDGEKSSRLTLMPLASIDAIPRFECTQPLHLLGAAGLANLRFVTRFINSTFQARPAQGIASDPKEINEAFSLFPIAPSVDTPHSVNYVYSLIQVAAMRALTHSLSIALTQPELITESVRQRQWNKADCDTPIAINSVESVMQAMMEMSAGGAALPLLSNLLALGQQVIPLTSGMGVISTLHSHLSSLHSHLSDVVTSPLSLSCHLSGGVSGVHPDLLGEATRLFPNDQSTAIQWCRAKQAEHRQAGEAYRAALEKPAADRTRPLVNLGFDAALCERALLLHNGDSNQSLQWLMSHGSKETDSIRRGELSEVWGLEGVDFYQEQGHWIPPINIAAEEKEKETNMQTQAGQTQQDDRKSPKTTVPGAAAGTSLPHPPPVMDPYRRLALYTSPQMSAQAMRSEKAYEQIAGRCSDEAALSNSVDFPSIPSFGWRLHPSDIRPCIGQRLRLCARWLTRQVQLPRPDRIKSEYRWYFLTEDNHWAPIERKDMDKIEECYESLHTTCVTLPPLPVECVLAYRAHVLLCCLSLF